MFFFALSQVLLLFCLVEVESVAVGGVVVGIVVVEHTASNCASNSGAWK